MTLTSHPHYNPTLFASLQSSPNTDIIEYILDTGTTFAITPHRLDFTSYVASSPIGISTVGGKTSIVGYGTVQWDFISFEGERHSILVPAHHAPAHHAPDSQVRLLFPPPPRDSLNFSITVKTLITLVVIIIGFGFAPLKTVMISKFAHQLSV
jgi:hypothetical protein